MPAPKTVASTPSGEMQMPLGESEEEPPPPPYERVVGQLRRAQDQHQGTKTSFLRKALVIVIKSTLGLVLVMMYLGILFGLAFASIGIGAGNLARCPIQPMILVYLVVSGAFTILQTLLSDGKSGTTRRLLLPAPLRGMRAPLS